VSTVTAVSPLDMKCNIYDTCKRRLPHAIQMPDNKDAIIAAVAPEAQGSSRYLSHENWNYPEACVLEVPCNNQFDPYNLMQIAYMFPACHPL